VVIVLSVLLITSLVSFCGNCVVCPSDNLFGIFLWQLCCLSFW
jgi:hypothetical protein